ncbi:hypothetical protein [Sorangium sp. So ce693]|uniref:hypothetical protein n=1 Tax=unclassified Sorangium TaxID=2621164 RepID=UPI003F5EBF22
MKRVLIAMCLVVAACGGEDEAEPVAWKDMSFEQRYAFMEDVVLPQMTETFVAFDAKFEGMNCATCHGGGAADGSYAMPSPQLPALPASEEAFAERTKDPEYARWGTWMFETVLPQMADQLQVATYDPATGTGFSCNSCHTLEGVEQ